MPYFGKYAHERKTIAVVIPTYNAYAQILNVISNIDEHVDLIYVVDDCCPERTGDMVLNLCEDDRVAVIKKSKNSGVGGATITGYKQALSDGADIIVKIDSDGQMNPKIIEEFVAPIANGRADYTKGNRFFNIEDLIKMPRIRIFGNASLSFITKLSSGYWNIFDPTNGYTAISKKALSMLPLEKISNRYFFETDMLFRLGLARAVVLDIAMKSVYADERSGLKIKKVIFEFTIKHIRNTIKRIFYTYYLRDMSIASFELPVGIILLVLGALIGFSSIVMSTITGDITSPGVSVFGAMICLMGLQLTLAFISYDINAVPKQPLSE